MVIGHSVGVAAALALADSVDVQDVNIEQLQAWLRDQGQVLTLAEQIPAPGVPPPPPAAPLPAVVTGACMSDNARATFNETLLLLGPTGLCASVLGYSVSNGATIVGANCHPGDRSPHHQNQEWVVDHQLIWLLMQNTASGGAPKCSRSCLARRGADVVLGVCSDTNSTWEIDAKSERVRAVRAIRSDQPACMQLQVL